MQPRRALFPALLLAAFTMLLSACGGNDKVEATFPKGQEMERKEARGKLTGESGLNLFGPSDADQKASNSPIGVNGFLWRATLDTLSFMPLVSADPFGGTIITDWYEDSGTPGERYKVNAVILDKTLRADGVRISVFKQKIQGGVWRDQASDDRLGRKLEDTILTRARQLRIAQLGR
jgi:hypothetical protein